MVKKALTNFEMWQPYQTIISWKKGSPNLNFLSTLEVVKITKITSPWPFFVMLISTPTTRRYVYLYPFFHYFLFIFNLCFQFFYSICIVKFLWNYFAIALFHYVQSFLRWCHWPCQVFFLVMSKNKEHHSCFSFKFVMFY